ncbi:MAG TPA: TerB family tellurite resistance protein, partial [Paracoccaceae bacterium]|nr:TerB family tellurite resistance protein [Paracoccaceae bacterium]
ADTVDDPRLAAAGVVVAVATMDGPISQAEIGRLTRAAQETFEISEREALELLSFGRWIAGECATNGEAVRRLSKIVLRTAGPEAGPDLVRMIEDVTTAGGSDLGPEERDAIATVRHAFGMEPARRRQG